MEATTALQNLFIGTAILATGVIYTVAMILVAEKRKIKQFRAGLKYGDYVAVKTIDGKFIRCKVVTISKLTGDAVFTDLDTLKPVITTIENVFPA